MKQVLPIFLLLVFLSGCAGEELTEVALIQVLGVDGGEEVRLTAVEGREGRIYHTRGRTVLEAQEGLKAVGEQRLEVTHVAQVVLGEGEDITATLWQEVVHRDSGYGATVWLSQGSAGELLEGTEDPVGRLRSLEENAGVAAPTLLEALCQLSRTGETVLPVLTAEEGELQVLEMRRVKGEWPVG